MELNPNHPVTQEVRYHWHKIAALLMIKFGQTKVRITPADIASMPEGTAISIDARPGQDFIEVRLVDAKTATRLAREEGGLPV